MVRHLFSDHVMDDLKLSMRSLSRVSKSFRLIMWGGSTLSSVCLQQVILPSLFHLLLVCGFCSYQKVSPCIFRRQVIHS